MRLIRKSFEASLYLLADHLDAVLAAGEDLLSAHRTLEACAPAEDRAAANGRTDLHQRFVEEVRTLELAIAMRGMEARRRADELRRADRRTEPVATLFLAGTAPLEDAAAELGDWTAFDFQTGNEVVAYLRSRRLVAPDCAGLPPVSELAVSAQFRIGRRVELGPFLDLAATFLDALELIYELYQEADAAADGAAPARSDLIGRRPGSLV